MKVKRSVNRLYKIILENMNLGVCYRNVVMIIGFDT